MGLGPFDTIEIVTLGINLVAFYFVHKAYKEGINTPASKQFWTYFLLVAGFVLFNRLFTNVEALAYKPFFNFLEHLSVLAAAVVFLLITKKTHSGETVA